MSSIAVHDRDLKRLGRIMAISSLLSRLRWPYSRGRASSRSPYGTTRRRVTIDSVAAGAGGSGKMDFVSMITTSDFLGCSRSPTFWALIVMAIIAGAGHWAIGTGG